MMARVSSYPSSNLNNIHPQPHDPHHPPPLYPPSWRPTTVEEFSDWNRSSQGTLSSTLVGPGLNPDLLPRSRPENPPNNSMASAKNPGKRKRDAPLGETSSVGGFGPSPRDATTEACPPGPPLPPLLPSSGNRRNAADDVWAFMRPLASAETLPEEQWPMSSEPHDTNKPKSSWVVCILCSEFG